MKWRRKARVERYAGLFTRWENALDKQLHQWSDLLQLKWDQLSEKQQYMLFMISCTSVSVVCATIILQVFK